MRKVILLSACLIVFGAALFLTPNQHAKVNSRRASGLPESSGKMASPRLTSFSQDSGSATDGLWQARKEAQTLIAEGALDDSSRTVGLNSDVLEQILQRAPMEFTAAAKDSQVLITLPMPNGTFQKFRIQESPIIQADLAARLPDVKTYSGQGIDDPTATTRFDWTPLGFHAIVLSAEDTVFVEPAKRGDSTEYATYSYGRSAQETAFACGLTDNDVREAESRGVYQHLKGGGFRPEVSNGATLRTYRLAVATTGEWYGLYGGGSVANAQTAVTSIINLVDAIYEREVAIRFTVVLDSDIIFTTAATDPYSTNAADATSLGENQTTLDNVAFLGSANYDVGHLFGGITGLGVGSSSFSGLASLGVVCTAGSKARGVSTMGNNPTLITAGIFVGGVAHELAHQFSAPHTFNSTESGCSGQRSATSAYEVGAGSTLMSYSICAASNLQGHNGMYFHVKSLEDIVSYATTSGTCATTSGTGNTAPTVTGPGNFTIPISTPFALNATASDSNGPLTYSWEEYDLAVAGTTGTYTDNGTLPLFRGYNPTPFSSRVFPSLTYILNNANTAPSTYIINGVTFLTGEVLPTTSRTMVFQVVVRDNQTSGGGINTATSTLTVSSGAGPFQVTAPNTAVAWTGGGAQTVTWNVNSTSSAPVSAANVKITLSTDGGFSFPVTLNASTTNDGTESITVPNGISTTTARVRVEAVGNIFFDISDTNFTITPGDGCPAVTDITPKVGNVGTVVSITGSNFTGVTAVAFNGTSAPTFTVNSATSISATTPAGATGGPITLTKGGCAATATTGYNVCPAASTTLSVDDGTVESAGNLGASNYFVNRLTPGSYPATLTAVQVNFRSFASYLVSTPITIIAGSTTSGSPDYTFFSETLATTVGTVDAFSTYTLPHPIRITSGDFVVGFIVDDPGATIFPALRDTSSVGGRSYYSDNKGNSYTSDPSGNYPIRANVFTGSCTGPTAAAANISGSIRTSAGAGVAGVTVRLTGAKSATTITDSKGNYRFDNVDSGGFYRVTPALANYQFGPSNLSFSLLGNKPDAVFTAEPDAVFSANALDTTEYFVRQMYVDFLGREPDQGGFDYWTNEINKCGVDADCVSGRRLDVAASFFVEREFQDTGSFIYRLYKASFGQAPRFNQFTPDRSKVVGGPNLDALRAGFVEEFVARDAFKQAYPDSMTSEQFVNQLFANTGLVPQTGEWGTYVSQLNNGHSRAEVLRQVIETTEFKQREYNPSFVLMEYFGYLRRDADQGGYDFWLDVLNNREPGNYRGMVCSFITSTEYQKRFSSVVTHTNAECGR